RKSFNRHPTVLTHPFPPIRDVVDPVSQLGFGVTPRLVRPAVEGTLQYSQRVRRSYASSIDLFENDRAVYRPREDGITLVVFLWAAFHQVVDCLVEIGEGDLLTAFGGRVCREVVDELLVPAMLTETCCAGQK